MAGTKESAHPK
jgi:serine/threonine protein kinase